MAAVLDFPAARVRPARRRRGSAKVVAPPPAKAPPAPAIDANRERALDLWRRFGETLPTEGLLACLDVLHDAVERLKDIRPHVYGRLPLTER